jgi:hypothetical protein
MTEDAILQNAQYSWTFIRLVEDKIPTVDASMNSKYLRWSKRMLLLILVVRAVVAPDSC